jgi:hypothetical protein
MESTTSRLLYVDGKQVGSKADVTTTFGRPIRVVLGVLDHSRNQRYWNGGLDDVRIYNRPLSSTEVGHLAGTPMATVPHPSSSEQDVPAATTILNWKPGVAAAKHNVYIGTDSGKVNDATTAVHPDVIVDTVDVNSYDPGGALMFDTTYYWRVDEVNGADSWRGSVWVFTTGSHVVLDDMESYGADETAGAPGPPPRAGSRIWFTWKDGEGWTKPSTVTGNGTGSLVDPNSGIVHGGVQSLKFWYDNSGTNPAGHGGKKYYSEIKANTSYLMDGQDWTKSNIKALALWFYGQPNNYVGATEQMYVKLNSTKIVYDGDMNDIKEELWHEWNIELSKFAQLGVNLSNVTEIAIGFGDETNTTKQGLWGVVYFDDIRLYQPRCVLSNRAADFVRLDYAPIGYLVSGDCVIDYGELDIMAGDWLTLEDYVIEPTANPAPASGLVAYYPLDEGTGTTTVDASGNTPDAGAFELGVTWLLPGLMGNSAVHVDGTAGYQD